MMLIRKSLVQILISVISFQLLASPVVASEQPEPSSQKKTKTLVELLKEEVMASPDNFFEKDDLEEAALVENKALMIQENQRIIEQLKDESISLFDIKRDINNKLVQEEHAHMVELKSLVTRMSIERVDAIFIQAMNSGNYDPMLQMMYESAYTAKEKKKILFGMLKSDLGMFKSKAVYKIGLMNRKELLNELETTGALLNTKGDGWKIAAIIVISVAVAGLATWGIIRATKKRYERKLKELIDEYENMNEEAEKLYKELNDRAEVDYYKSWDDLYEAYSDTIDKMINDHLSNMDATKQQYNTMMSELKELFETRADLRNQGYVWSICSVKEETVTMSCPYNSMTYTGVKVCASHCLKNPATGDMVGETSLTCTNSEVPTNCSTPNAYNSGYNSGAQRGYSDGYNDGYDATYTDAYNSAYNDFYTTGHEDGYDAGFDRGFSKGYSDGLAQAQYDSDLTYDQGHADGIDASDESYDDGYYWGGVDSQDDYNQGVSDGLIDSNETYNEGYSSGYSEGYAYAQSL